MALNKYMHPRNPYRTPPNFAKLAQEFDEFRKICKTVDISGKVKLDFNNPESLKILAEVLLKKDFNLNVEIPNGRLVPRLPLRLNYLLWIEDLLENFHFLSNNSEIKGIDIGTGGSCIYPLLASRKFHWKMLATETDENNYKTALNNISNNSLNEDITVKLVTRNTILKDLLDNCNDDYHFTMCNPPFFNETNEEIPQDGKTSNAISQESLTINDDSNLSEDQDLDNEKNKKCKTESEKVIKLSTNKLADLIEISTPGGEINFITKMINDSKSLESKVSIFTSMVGHKSSLQPLKKLIKGIIMEKGSGSLTTTEFCQGRIVRWGIAWTFLPNLDLSTVIGPLALEKLKKQRTPLRQIILFDDVQSNDLEIYVQNLEKILLDLKINVIGIVFYSDLIAEISIETKVNTWSHSRKRRRELIKQTIEKHDEDLKRQKINSETEMTTNVIEDASISSSNNDDSSAEVETNSEKNSNSLLTATILCTTIENGFCIEIDSISGSGGRDTAHQLLQYIKNHVK